MSKDIFNLKDNNSHFMTKDDLQVFLEEIDKNGEVAIPAAEIWHQTESTDVLPATDQNLGPISRRLVAQKKN